MTDAWDGRPANPERDGWHWLHHAEDLRPCPTPWDADHAAWCSGGMHSPRGVVDLGYCYLGPCLTPAEVAAQRDAAWRAGRDAAISVVRASGYVDKSIMTVALSMLQPPADLAAATGDAVAQEREAIASMFDDIAARKERAGWSGVVSSNAREYAAAIRARGRSASA